MEESHGDLRGFSAGAEEHGWVSLQPGALPIAHGAHASDQGGILRADFLAERRIQLWVLQGFLVGGFILLGTPPFARFSEPPNMAVFGKDARELISLKRIQ